MVKITPKEKRDLKKNPKAKDRIGKTGTYQASRENDDYLRSLTKPQMKDRVYKIVPESEKTLPTIKATPKPYKRRPRKGEK